MKVRTGFVSNSSSSSFICQVSNEIYSGYDASLSNFELFECKKGHIFGESYAVSDPFSEENVKAEALRNFTNNAIYDYAKVKGITNSKIPEDILEGITIDSKLAFSALSKYEIESYITDAESEMRYCVPEACCPICQMKHISDDDAISYILKSKNTNMKKLKEEIKNTFINYKHFMDYIK